MKGHMYGQFLITRDFCQNIEYKHNQHTVKSLLVAAATIKIRSFLLRPLFKGGYNLRAATNKKFVRNLTKSAINERFLLIFTVISKSKSEQL